MSNIEVGEYIRTEDGFLTKYIRDLVFNTIEVENDGKHHIIAMTNIKNHSKNIIDLIEIGDYVNGHLVINIETDKNNKRITITENKYFDKYYEDGIAKIETIVTKEMFKEMEYRVDE